MRSYRNDIFITELRKGVMMKEAAKIAGISKRTSIRLAREAGVSVRRLQQLRQTKHETFISDEYAQSVRHWQRMEWANHPVAVREVMRLRYHNTKTPEILQRARDASKRRHHRLKHCPIYKAKQKAKQRIWEAKPKNRMRVNLGIRLSLAIREGGGCKDQSVLQIIGCTLPELNAHIQRQFVRGMSWDNYGSVWHVDHRVPCSYFDLNRHDEQRRCFHFSNLRPMFAEQNCLEGNRRGECAISLGI